MHSVPRGKEVISSSRSKKDESKLLCIQYRGDRSLVASNGLGHRVLQVVAMKQTLQKLGGPGMSQKCVDSDVGILVSGGERTVLSPENNYDYFLESG